MKDLFIQDKETIVFTGDSVTDAGRKRPLGEGLWEGTGTGFVRQVENAIVAFYPERMIRIINTGCSGNDSKQLLDRFQTDVIDLKPNYAVITIGFNDVWRFFDEPTVFSEHVQLGEYKANVQKMLDMCKEAKIKAILMTPYYMELNLKDPMRIKMDEYRKEYMELAKKNGVDCIDLQKVFDDYCAKRYTSFITWDRIHPNHVGSTLICTEFLKYAGFDFDRLK